MSGADRVALRLPLKSGYFTTLRLAASGVCAQMGFDIEGIEDFKIAVNESALLLMRAGYEFVAVEFVLGDNLTAVVSGEGKGCDFAKADSIGENFSCMLIEELVDSVDIKRQDGELLSVTLSAVRG